MDKQHKYLTFSFFNNGDGMELRRIGWMPLRSRTDKPYYMRDFMHLFGSEVPVVNLKIFHEKNIRKTINNACIVIFRQMASYACYFGIVVEKLSNVVNDDGTENKLSPLLLSAREHLSNDDFSINRNKILPTIKKPSSVN